MSISCLTVKFKSSLRSIEESHVVIGRDDTVNETHRSKNNCHKMLNRANLRRCNYEITDA